MTKHYYLVTASSDGEDVKETHPAEEIQRVQAVENEAVIESSSNKPNKIVISENVSQRHKNPNRQENQFRHSNQNRRKILKGRKVDSANSGAKCEITGSSTSQHRIQAANYDTGNADTPHQPKTSLVYVGGLSRHTTEDDIRAHLQDIGVSNNSIGDVLKLRSRTSNQTSFCISLSDPEYESLIYDEMKWPNGIRVRPYRQRQNNPAANKRRSYPRRYQRNEPPPRFRDQNNRRSFQHYGSLDSNRLESSTGNKGYHDEVNTHQRSAPTNYMYTYDYSTSDFDNYVEYRPNEYRHRQDNQNYYNYFYSW